jgi:hypothetical protein
MGTTTIDAMPAAGRRIRFPLKLVPDRDHQIGESHDLHIDFQRNDPCVELARRVIAAFGEIKTAPRFRTEHVKVVEKRLTEFIARNVHALATGFALPCEIPLSFTEPSTPGCLSSAAFAPAASPAPLPQSAPSANCDAKTAESKPLEETNVPIGGRRRRNRHPSEE